MSELYLAGKIGFEELAIPEFCAELEDRGHQVPVKWWEEGRLPKPYLDHIPVNGPAAEKMIKAAKSADIFILFPEDNIMGALVELGAAIASQDDNPDKQVIIVNPFEVRQSAFYTHPGVLAVRGLEIVRAMPWY